MVLGAFTMTGDSVAFGHLPYSKSLNFFNYACVYLCLFPAAATWVGGAFIIGVAELVYDPTKGLMWALVPLQVSISFVIGKPLHYG